jgi:hypothetical protein
MSKAGDITSVALGETFLLRVGGARVGRVLGARGNGEEGGEEDLGEAHFGLTRVLYD